jgi:hypothetical protein
LSLRSALPKSHLARLGVGSERRSPSRLERSGVVFERARRSDQSRLPGFSGRAPRDGRRGPSRSPSLFPSPASAWGRSSALSVSHATHRVGGICAGGRAGRAHDLSSPHAGGPACSEPRSPALRITPPDIRICNALSARCHIMQYQRSHARAARAAGCPPLGKATTLSRCSGA